MNNKLPPEPPGADDWEGDEDTDNARKDDFAQFEDDAESEDDQKDWETDPDIDAAEEDSQQADWEAATDQASADENDRFSPGFIARPQQDPVDTPDERSELWPDQETADEDSAWGDDDSNLWQEEEEAQEPPTPNGGHWPLGLIAIALVALLLLSVGGYGVLQQRGEMQEEIRLLQANLATAAEPQELASNRETLRQLEQRNQTLESEVDTLQLAAQSMRDTIAGLETQLTAQREAMNGQGAATKPAQQASTTASTTPKGDSPGSSASADWFVNFGSYSQRSAAQSWAARLQPAKGTVVIATGAKGGSTFYRVRIVELVDKKEATAIARQLEQEFSLEKLWIGQQ